MDSKKWVEVEAPTVEEAAILGLTRLGILREEALIEVLDEGNKGFLGIGARQARVRVTHEPQRTQSEETAAPQPVVATPRSPQEPQVAQPSAAKEKPAFERSRPQPDGAARAAKQPSTRLQPASAMEAGKLRKAETLKPKPRSEQPAPSAEPVADEGFDRERIEQLTVEIAEHLFADLDLELKTQWRQEDRPTLWLSLTGKEANALVGHRGQTLRAVQHLLRALVRKQSDGNFSLVVDADGFRRRHYHSLQRLASRMADKAVQSGKAVRLRPMSANERRIVHMALRSDARVHTKSFGSGRDRAVQVIPNKA